MGGTVPDWLLSTAIGATLFTVMSGLGLGIALRELAAIWRHPALLARSLLGVIVLMPIVALAVIRALDLPREAAIGFVLMAVAPGAPLTLKRSLSAGGHRAFAPALQISTVAAAVVAMPVWLAALDRLHASVGGIEPAQVARQVLVAQLVPLGLGIALRAARPALAERIRARAERAGSALLVVAVALVLVDGWSVAVDAGVRSVAAIVLITAAGLAIGHLLGGPVPSNRTAVAMTTAARNPGLALWVAALKDAPPVVTRSIMAYLLVSIVVLVPYTAWRRRPRFRVSPAP